MTAGEQVEQYLRDELGYPQSGRVVLAIRAADQHREFGMIVIGSTDIYIVTRGHAGEFYQPYFQEAMKTAHLCWWEDGKLEKALSADEFKARMRRL